DDKSCLDNEHKVVQKLVSLSNIENEVTCDFKPGNLLKLWLNSLVCYSSFMILRSSRLVDLLERPRDIEESEHEIEVAAIPRVKYGLIEGIALGEALLQSVLSASSKTHSTWWM
ncbi:unnamed protein product, partial [Hymenolepis diminuta]